MANYNGGHSVFVASSASVGTDLIVMSGHGFSIKVTNVGGTAPLWYTASFPGGPCPVPSVNEVKSRAVAATANASSSDRQSFQFGAVVQVASTGTTAYLVELQGNHATS